MSTKEMPRWRVNQKSMVGNALVEEGTEVFYTPGETATGGMGEVSENLTPLNDAAQKIIDEQASEHPDQTGGVGYEKAIEARAEKAIVRDDNIGPVPVKEAAKGAKGDTRTPGAGKRVAPKKVAEPKAKTPGDADPAAPTPRKQADKAVVKNNPVARGDEGGEHIETDDDIA